MITVEGAVGREPSGAGGPSARLGRWAVAGRWVMAAVEVIPSVDRLVHSWQARLTGGQSPTSSSLAYLDWAVHLAQSPGKQAQLAAKAARKGTQLAGYTVRRMLDRDAAPCITPLPQDHRFDHAAW